MRKKLTALALVLVMAVSLVAGMTLSYFTDQKTVTNIFTVGGVSIRVYEHEYINGVATGKLTDEGSSYKNVVPGVAYPKDPTIDNTGDTSAYIRMLVTVPTLIHTALGEVTFDNLKGMLVGLDDTKFELVGTRVSPASDTATYIFNYKEKLEPNDAPVVLFTAFKMPANIADQPVESGSQLKVTIQGQAIQTEGFDSRTDALRALDTAYNNAN